MPRIQIPDRQELAIPIEDTLRAEFPQVHFWAGMPKADPVDLVLEVDAAAFLIPGTVPLRLLEDRQEPRSFRLPGQWLQLKEELGRRLDALEKRSVPRPPDVPVQRPPDVPVQRPPDVPVQRPPDVPVQRPPDLESGPELPALGDELFTLGGVPVPREPAFTEPHPVIDDLDDEPVGDGSAKSAFEAVEPASPVEDPLFEAQVPSPDAEAPAFSIENPAFSAELPLAEEVFNLGTSERRVLEPPRGAPAEQVTAPGILRRNTVVVPAGGFDPAAERPQPAPSEGPFDGNVALHFLRLHQSGFTGAIELALPQFTVRMSWEAGRVGDLEGYAPILQHLLALAGAGSSFAADLTRTLSDPIDWAVRRQLISPDEEVKWLLRCRREAIRLAITATRCPVPADGAEFRRHLPPLDPKPLLFSGVVEHFAPDLACALCDCAPPVSVPAAWHPLFDDPDFDPLWVRAVHLLFGGTPWSEACIRAGLTLAESWTLAYAVRLFQLGGPALPEGVPAAELKRRRFRTLEENLRTLPPDQFFGGSPAAARRVHQDILVQVSEFPGPLRMLLAADFEKLKKSMDKSMSLLSF